MTAYPMKIGLITTTINVPGVLELYRKLDPDVRFFVASDMKTPHDETTELCDRIGNCDFISQLRQSRKNYEHSELIGWNTDSRRNIALLEALKWGADLIVSIDDDMIPMQSEFVPADVFEFGFSGLQLGAPRKWFDAGLFTVPPAHQRGLPPTDYEVDWNSAFVANAKIGAWQGIILGVPDTGAVTAIHAAPKVLGTSDILRNGFVVHPQAFSVFNSQFTAFRRELAPAFAQFYKHQGRNTDIFASMLMRRIMQDQNLYTYFGPPMAFHARTPRPLFKDLKAEMWGLEHIEQWAMYLAMSPLPDISVTDQCRVLTEACPIFSDKMKACARAWYNDCDKVM